MAASGLCYAHSTLWESHGFLRNTVLLLYLQGSLGWRLLFGVAVLPAAAVLVVVPWLYETPHR
jgi:hypothetical protein